MAKMALPWVCLDCLRCLIVCLDVCKYASQGYKSTITFRQKFLEKHENRREDDTQQHGLIVGLISVEHDVQ